MQSLEARDEGWGMMDEIKRFRETMASFATGVTVVTAVDPERGAVGLTANSVASVSLNPRLVLVCVAQDSASLGAILASGHFGLSVLASGDEDLARRFSAEPPDHRFRGLELRESVSGVPLLSNSVAWVECQVWKSVDAGDHMIVIGRVEACGPGPGTRPLVFFRRRYGTFST